MLNLGEYFEGVISCDYASTNFSCKPEEGAFQLLPFPLPCLSLPPSFLRQTNSPFPSFPPTQPTHATQHASAEYFTQSLLASGSVPPSQIYFVDDSALNIKGAHSLKWGHCVLFDETGDQREKLGGLETVDTEGKEEEGKVSVVEDILGELLMHVKAYGEVRN